MSFILGIDTGGTYTDGVFLDFEGMYGLTMPLITMAIEVTKLVHGQDALDRAEKISSALFGGGFKNLSAAEIEEGFSDVSSVTIEKPDIGLLELLIQAKAVSSKRQAREAIVNGAIYINDIRHTDVETTVPQLERIDGKYLVLRRGKKNHYLIKFNIQPPINQIK